MRAGHGRYPAPGEPQADVPLHHRSRVAAMSRIVGPEHGTVGPQQVKEAAKEAVLGIGVDILIDCGFAFDPHVAEEAEGLGKLTERRTGSATGAGNVHRKISRDVIHCAGNGKGDRRQFLAATGRHRSMSFFPYMISI